MKKMPSSSIKGLAACLTLALSICTLGGCGSTPTTTTTTTTKTYTDAPLSSTGAQQTTVEKQTTTTR